MTHYHKQALAERSDASPSGTPDVPEKPASLVESLLVTVVNSVTVVKVADVPGIVDVPGVVEVELPASSIISNAQTSDSTISPTLEATVTDLATSGTTVVAPLVTSSNTIHTDGTLLNLRSHSYWKRFHLT